MKNYASLRSWAKAKAGLIMIGLAGVFYLIDCAVAYGDPHDVAWIKSGVYAGGLVGFWTTTLPMAVFGLGYALFNFIRSRIEKK